MKNFYNICERKKWCPRRGHGGGENMALDMEIVYGNDEYEQLQRYFESRRNSYPYYSKSTQERIKEEYIVERWEDNERDKVSNRRKALDRISRILEEIPSNSENISIEKTKKQR